MTDRLLLDERLTADGRSMCSWASVSGAAIRIVDDDGLENTGPGLPEAGSAAEGRRVDGRLSVTALERVMTRYARPLDGDVVLDGPVLELGDGRRLRRLRYHTPVDAIARDYLVWEHDGHEPIAVIATMATSALRYLVLRLSQESEA